MRHSKAPRLEQCHAKSLNVTVDPLFTGWHFAGREHFLPLVMRAIQYFSLDQFPFEIQFLCLSLQVLRNTAVFVGSRSLAFEFDTLKVTAPLLLR